MNWPTNFFILGAAFLSVFWQSAFDGLRHLLGVQVDLLPPIMVYAALCGGITSVALLSCLGGIWLDALSANPLGISILPLFLAGVVIWLVRDLILRDEAFAQLVVGLAVSSAVPLLTLLILLTLGYQPLFGWGTVWQLIVMSVGGALATPVFFIIFEWLHRALAHGHMKETSFRPDREIRRGRI